MRGTQRVSGTSIMRSRALHSMRVESSYDPDTGTVTFATTMNSFTFPGDNHVVMVSFSDVPANQLLNDPDSLEENRERNDGQLIPIPITAKNPMSVRCSCFSFRFTGSEAAINNNAFIGKNYTPWIPSKHTRPPRNPHNIPMLCKHLITFITYLYDKGYIVASHL